MNIGHDIFDYLETTSLEPHDDYTSEISYKDQKIIWNRLKSQQNEINQLNNIINELEKWLDEESEKTILSVGHLTCLMMCKNKLKELKGE